MLPPIQNETPKVTILDPAPSYVNFLHEHLQRNSPCLICPGLTSHWPAFALWAMNQTTDSSSASPSVVLSKPNWEYIRTQYGDEVVSVAQCNSKAFSDQERTDRPLRDVIDIWATGAGEGLYVKDWHLARTVRERGDPPFYNTPEIYADDWMNSFWEQEGKDDFRFVYMGVKGTFTPLHRDVYTSYSWSTNITGTKLWRLFPPSVSHHLRRYPERTASEIVYDVRDVDCGIFHGFEAARREMLLVEQYPGWTIFVPSGWYHQVENVTDAISINHNWCNITNLPSMYIALLSAVSDVESALADVHDLLRTRSGNPEWEREWTAVVQDVLRKDSGWDWTTFWRMIVHNLGQLRDPPLVLPSLLSTARSVHAISQIPDSVWPPTPKTLRPPLEQTRPILGRLVEDFASTRAMDVMHISNLSEILDTLRSFLSSS